MGFSAPACYPFPANSFSDLDLDELNRRFFSAPNSTSVFFVRHPFVRMISAFQVSQINI